MGTKFSRIVILRLCDSPSLRYCDSVILRFCDYTYIYRATLLGHKVQQNRDSAILQFCWSLCPKSVALYKHIYMYRTALLGHTVQQNRDSAILQFCDSAILRFRDSAILRFCDSAILLVFLPQKCSSIYICIYRAAILGLT